jgi:hypothetical protein
MQLIALQPEHGLQGSSFPFNALVIIHACG